MSGISAVIKDNPESSLIPSTMWGCNVKMASYGPGSRSSQDTESTSALILDFPISPSLQNCGKFLLFISHAVHSILLQQSEQNRMTPKTVSERTSPVLAGGCLDSLISSVFKAPSILHFLHVNCTYVQHLHSTGRQISEEEERRVELHIL